MTLRTSRLARVAAATLSGALLATVLLATPARAAEGDPSITYDAATNTLTVGDGSGSTDLFANFKGVVPGDTITQDVNVDLRNVSAATRLYVRADTSHVDQATVDALADGVILSVTFDQVDGVNATPQTGAPTNIFATDGTYFVAEALRPMTTTMHLTLTVDTSVGNEVSDLAARIPWIVTVEEEDDGGDSTALEVRATDLTAYEGGVGSSASDGADALPEPEWLGVDWDTARVTVDNEVWSVAEKGLPFRWSYGTVADDPALVTASARAGAYYLLAAPLEGNPVVTVNGKVLVLPQDYVVTTADGSDVITLVRDVTDNAAADALSPALFRYVYGSEAEPTPADLLSGLVSAAWTGGSAGGSSTLESDGYISTGVHGGDCDSSVPHAHVEAGTTFVRNGNADLPVNDGARIALLWDDLLSSVLGIPEHEAALDAKAREAVGWENAEGVRGRFKYLDLVDMNDGNVWVSTADGSAVTVFVPYFDGISAEDEIAVAYFDGLTRDYTIDMASSDLGSEVAASGAHALEVTKASDGITFSVPSGEFGPFELLWRSAADDGGTDDGGPTDDGTNDGGPAADKPHTGPLANTGDVLPTVMPVLAVVGAALVIVAVVLLRRQRRQ